MHTLRWSCLAALLLLIVGMVPAAAAGGSIGVIDFQEVMKGYTGAKFATSLLSDFYTENSKQFEAQQLGIGLSAEDFETYNKLLKQEAPEKAALKTLTDKSDANRKRFVELREKLRNSLSRAEKRDLDQLYSQIINSSSMAVIDDKTGAAELKEFESDYAELEKKGKAALSDAEQKEYDQLSVVIKKNQINLNKQDDEYRQKMDLERQRYQGIFADELNKAVAKVAKDQKLSIVVSKNVQTAQGSIEKFVLWSEDGVDITKKVVDVLNASFNSDMLKPKK